jgi:outer membrane protein assembly factor BamA
MLGFTQPYMFDRPLQFGVSVFGNRISYNQARQLSILQRAESESVGGATAEPAELFAIEHWIDDRR